MELEKFFSNWPVDNVAAALVGTREAALGDDTRVFELASVTKLLSAYAVLLAVEEGAFSLDDDAPPDFPAGRASVCTMDNETRQYGRPGDEPQRPRPQQYFPDQSEPQYYEQDYAYDQGYDQPQYAAQPQYAPEPPKSSNAASIALGVFAALSFIAAVVLFFVIGNDSSNGSGGKGTDTTQSTTSQAPTSSSEPAAPSRWPTSASTTG